MIVYKYDEKTGVYASNVQAQESPREPGVYLIPAMATDVMPPATGKNECPVWENGKWTVKPNFRGTKYWLPDGSEHSITEINVVPPADALFEKPIIPPTFEEAKAAKLAELDTAFTSASETAYCMSSAGFEINADEIANRNIEGLVLVLKPEERTLFRAYDNSFHEVTKEQLETMRKEIVVNSQRLYGIKWQIEAAIEAAQTVDELDAIYIVFEPDITGGQPIAGASYNTDTPVAFTEQRNQSIYGSEVSDGQTA